MRSLEIVLLEIHLRSTFLIDAEAVDLIWLKAKQVLYWNLHLDLYPFKNI